MFGKSKPDPSRAETRRTDGTLFSAPRPFGTDPIAAAYVFGLRIRTG
jgi:hypothetical protein